VSCAPPPESLGPAGAKGSESLRGGQAQFVSDGFVAGDGQAGGSRLPRVALGERLGSGQPHLVADRGVAGDSSKGFGSGAGVVAGELLGGGQAVLIGIAVHGCGGSLCEVAGSAGPRGVLLDVPEDLLHLVDLVTDLGELHADLGELQVGVLLGGDRHL
jgi:hypothetical protein